MYNNYSAMIRSSWGCSNCHPLVQGVEGGDLYWRCCDLCKHGGETWNKGTAQTSEASPFLTDNDLTYLHQVRRHFVSSKYRCCSVLWHHLFTASESFNPGWAQSLPLLLQGRFPPSILHGKHLFGGTPFISLSSWRMATVS